MINNEIITKSNVLNEARYRLTVLEQKIVLVVVSQIQLDDDDFMVYKFKVTELTEILEIERRSIYTEIKRITANLLKKPIIILLENGDTLMTNWFSLVKYRKNKGIVEFKFEPELKPFLLRLKERFISYPIRNIIQLKSFYSIRFYELLKQYEKIGYRLFQLDELKIILGITSEYAEYKNFKAKVLEVAKRELGEKTDISFLYEETRENRHVKTITFIIKTSPNNKMEKMEKVDQLPMLLFEEDTKLPNLIAELLPPEQRNKKAIIHYIDQQLRSNDIKKVARNIEYANKNSDTNYIAFLKQALQNDWGVEEMEKKKAKKAKIKADKSKAKRKARKKADDKKKQEKINDYIDANYDELKVQAMKILDNEMLKELKEKSPLGRLALIGAMSQIAETKLIVS